MKKKLLLILFVCFYVKAMQAQSFWYTQESGTTAPLYGVDFIDEENGIAVGGSGTILRTSNGGLTWEAIDSVRNLTLNAVSYIDANNIVVVGDSAILLKSPDGGISWYEQFVDGIYEADLLSVDMSPSGKGIIGGHYMTLITTTDGFDTKLILRKNYTGVFNSVRILDDDNAFAFGSNGVFQSVIHKVAHFDSLSSAIHFYVFNGERWGEGHAFDGYAFNNDSVLTVGDMADYKDPGICSYITRKNQPWDDNFWYPVYKVDSAFYLGVDFINNYGIAVGGKIYSNIISESSDQGSTWKEVLSPVTECYLYDVKLLNTAGYIVGENGLIMKTQLPSVGYRSQFTDYHLNVYPNPASDYCMLSLVNPTNRNVTISLYSSEGKLINTVFNGNLSPGSHEFRIPVRQLESGLYYCTFMAGEQVTTKKISIVK